MAGKSGVKLSSDEVSRIRAEWIVDGYTHFCKELLNAGVSYEKLKEASVAFWRKLAEEFARRVKEQFKLGGSLEEASIPVILMGSQIAGYGEEAEPGKHLKVYDCPWFKAIEKYGLNRDFWMPECIACYNAIVKVFNPRYEWKLVKALPRGDECC